jgi:hypothetical protein
MPPQLFRGGLAEVQLTVTSADHMFTKTITYRMLGPEGAR